MEKLFQQVQWTGPGAINRHSNYTSTASPPQVKRWIHFTASTESVALLEVKLQAGRADQEPGQAFQQLFTLSCFQQGIIYHVWPVQTQSHLSILEGCQQV